MNSDPIVPSQPRAGSPERIHVVRDEALGGSATAPAASPRPTLVSPLLAVVGAPSGPPVFADPRSAAAGDALRLALDEGHVFAALTGLPGVGKTAVLEAVLAATPALRVLRIQDPGSVSDRLAAQIEHVALSEGSRPDADAHVLLVVDDAHLASVELLDALSRLAAVRRAGGRLPQLLLVGQPTLWDRLKAERFRPLERRLVIRPELSPAPAADAWSSLEQALSPPASPGPAARPAALSPARPTARPTARPAAVPASPPVSAKVAAAKAPLPRSAQPFTGETDLEPMSRIESLVARRAELVPATEEDRRSPRPFIIALMIVAVATVLLAATVQLGFRVPDAFVAPIAAGSPTPAATAATPGTEPPSRAANPPAPIQSAPDQSALAQSSPAQSSPAQPAPPTGSETATLEPPASEAAPPPVVPVSAPQEPATSPALAASAQSDPAPPASPPAAMAPDVVALMVRRGEDRLALGDIVAARSFFERAGAGGNARAAFLAGRTYDRSFLPADAARLANPAQATDWYRRAASAGDAAAATRLQQLGAPAR